MTVSSTWLEFDDQIGAPLGFGGFGEAPVTFDAPSLAANLNPIDLGATNATPTNRPTTNINVVNETNFAPGQILYIQNVAFNADDKVSVISVPGQATYQVDILLEGSSVDDEIISGSVNSGNVIPVAMFLEDGHGDGACVIDLSAGPMTYGHYLALGHSAQQTGAYLLNMTGSSFASSLAQIDTYKSVDAVYLSSGMATLQNNVQMRPSYVEIAGAIMYVEEALTYAGDLTVLTGALGIAANASLVATGIVNDHSNIAGAGTLAIGAGGDLTAVAGSAIGVRNWVSRGTNTAAALDMIGADEVLTFKGAFDLGQFATVNFGEHAGLQLNNVTNIGGVGGSFAMGDGGDDALAINGVVSTGEHFSIGSDDKLSLVEAETFHGVIDSLHGGGEISMIGVWTYVGVSQAAGDTLLSLKDVADGFTASIAFAGSFTPGSFLLSQQLKGVTPTTLITM